MFAVVIAFFCPSSLFFYKLSFDAPRPLGELLDTFGDH